MVRTYDEVAVRATELAEVLVGSANDDLLHLDLSAIAESDGQVRESGFVEPLAGVHVGLEQFLRGARLC
ncbi:MAG: hypothetical protein EOP04_15705 [Proteobacteria bacterium]|nr:MAG: hypothetical protein EOP04_15705 [Pseudomonadota bacterium]